MNFCHTLIKIILYFWKVAYVPVYTNLIQKTPKWPHIWFEVVPCFMNSLWRHVIRCSNCRKHRKENIGYKSNRIKEVHCTDILHKLSDLPREWAAVVLELKNLPSPKSPSLTIPSAVINTFAGLISERKKKLLDFKESC